MLVGFHVLQNGSFVKVFYDKIEILDNDVLLSINVNASCINQRAIITTYLLEIEPNYFAIVYTDMDDRISFLGIVDLNQSRLTDFKIIPHAVNGLFLVSENEILLLCFSKQIIFLCKNGNLSKKNHLYFQGDFVRYPPVFIPEIKNFIGTISLNNTPTVYSYSFLPNRYLDLGSKQRDVLDVLVLPSDHIALLTNEIDEKKKLIYSNIKICDRQFSLLSQINLAGYMNRDSFFYYHSIKLLQNKYLLVIGDTMRDPKAFVQIFEFHSNQLRKINEIIIDNKELIAFNPDGQLLTCHEEGNIVLHHFCSESEKINKIISSKIPVKSLVNIVSDYCGLFRRKSEKENSKLLYKEVEHPMNKNGCVIL